MSDTSRRDILKNAAFAAAALGSMEPGAAQHVHTAVATEKSEKGKYSPKFFKEAEWQSVGAFAEIVCPGAAKGGASEFVDLLCSTNSQLATIWTGGLAWMAFKLGKPFHEAAAADQTALLDKIAYFKNMSPELAPGIRFFDMARRMVFDAYYTSAAGTAELGYLGNVGVSEFKVPEESLQYALRRSPFANG